MDGVAAESVRRTVAGATGNQVFAFTEVVGGEQGRGGVHR